MRRSRRDENQLMGRKSSIDKLPENEFDFVIKEILDGKTDREISSVFEKKFKKELPKSNLNSWRNKAGNELAERYRLKRFQVRSFVEELKAEGIEVEDDKYKLIIQSLEDHLLTFERDLIKENPIKLLFARQEDERLKIKRETLELNRSKLEFDREKLKNAIDREKVGVETMTDFMEYADGNVDIIKVLTVHLKPFVEFLKKKYAES